MTNSQPSSELPEVFTAEQEKRLREIIRQEIAYAAMNDLCEHTHDEELLPQ